MKTAYEREKHYWHLFNVASFFGKKAVAEYYFQLYCKALQEQ
jgi:hypothetical protein